MYKSRKRKTKRQNKKQQYQGNSMLTLPVSKLVAGQFTVPLDGWPPLQQEVRRTAEQGFQVLHSRWH